MTQEAASCYLPRDGAVFQAEHARTCRWWSMCAALYYSALCLTWEVCHGDGVVNDSCWT